MKTNKIEGWIKLKEREKVCPVGEEIGEFEIEKGGF